MPVCIKRKTLRRGEWRGDWETRFAFRPYRGFGGEGVAALLRVDRAAVPLLRADGALLCGAGCDWLQLAPRTEPWWCSAFFSAEGQPMELYFDLTAGNRLCGADSYFDDYFLDIVADPRSGSVERRDEDELLLALKAGLLTPAQAETVLRAGARLERRLRQSLPALTAELLAARQTLAPLLPPR